MTAPSAIRIIVHGQVQGVGYRAWLAEQARLSGIKGWVRNRRDGTVEALFHPGAWSPEEFLLACRHGPSPARVSDIEVFEEAAPSDIAQEDDFAILPTA